MKIDGGSAFPTMVEINTTTSPDKILQTYIGMTLRDYFAAKAMQGILSNHETDWSGGDDATDISQSAYSAADAMLKERDK